MERRGNALRFSAHDPAHGSLLGHYATYGKLEGWQRALRLGLPVSEVGFLFTSSTTAPPALPPNTVLLCRPDAPPGLGQALPRGRDLRPHQVPYFVEEVQALEPSAVVVAFLHPSLQFTGAYLPRYRMSGAATILRLQSTWIVEYVGPGYDVGDLTRGTAVHVSLRIPSEALGDSVSSILRYARALPGSLWQINRRAYSECRARRVSTLIRDLHEDAAQDIRHAIPTEPPVLSLSLLRSLQKIIWQIAYRPDQPLFRQHETLLLNIYPGPSIHAFEIWQPHRSKPLSLHA
jgi:hypothetical protein